MALNIFIDVNNKALLSSQTGGTIVQGTALPLFYPDQITLNVYLIQAIPNSQQGTAQYQSVPTIGISLLLYIDGGSEGSPILTQTVDWQSDPTSTFFIGELSLNTLKIKQLLGPSISKQAYLKIGFVEQGVSTTLIATAVSIQAGLPTNPLVVPAELVPLSVQAALQMFVPINGLPDGQGFFLTTPNGKKLFIQAIDQPDGTASFLASPVN